MGWPKGKPRKGHINKDGKPHAKRGSKQPEWKDLVKEVIIRAPVKREADPATADPAEEPQLHGMVGSGAITEVCPNCQYAYADGGYCPSCGWSLPVERDPYGTHSGRRF